MVTIDQYGKKNWSLRWPEAAVVITFIVVAAGIGSRFYGLI